MEKKHFARWQRVWYEPAKVQRDWKKVIEISQEITEMISRVEKRAHRDIKKNIEVIDKGIQKRRGTSR